MTELLLVLGVLAIVVVFVRLAISLALEGIRLTLAFFTLPVEPPGLVRLRKLLEAALLEQEAAEADARRRYPPPPEIVIVLRTIAESGEQRGRRAGTWSTSPLGH
jgi:hypothetical protein